MDAVAGGTEAERATTRFASIFSAYLPNPAAFSYKSWAMLGGLVGITYLWQISTLSRRSRNAPCPDHGSVLRVLYGLFSTWVAEKVLGNMLHTKRDEPQAEQAGGTLPVVMGPPEMRIKVVPILGQAFGGNYAYLIWDEEDPDRRAIVVDPADPYPVLRAAAEEKLNLEVLLTTHWHFDHVSTRVEAERPPLSDRSRNASRPRPL